MKTLIIALALCCSSLAVAEKTFDTEKTATWDCSKDAAVVINRASGKFTLKGACKEITINGGHNTVTIEGIATLTINGSSNTVTAEAIEAVTMTGSDNKVAYKKSGGTGGKPTISSLGQNNKVNGPS